MIHLPRTASLDLSDQLSIAVFAALPTLGLIAGPSYAALVFGLGVTQAVLAMARCRHRPAIDRQLAMVAVAFALLCWASVMWSVDPPRSQQAALQMTAILAGALLVLAVPRPGDAAIEPLFRTLAAATIAGTAVFITDAILGYPLQAWLLGRPPPFVGTKYSRGLTHLMLLVWPMAAFILWRRDGRLGLPLAACLLASLAMTASLAARAAAAAGLIVLLLAWGLPRIVAPLLAAGMVLLTAGLPVALNALADDRPALAGYLKHSGLHRLEIWDYMNLHVLERPLLGWGIAAASRLPTRLAELSQYTILHDPVIYPHNQWLELWVETGLVGAAMGLIFALLVLVRIGRLPVATRPFAYAAFASAVVVSSVNFEVLTDSWWAALAATAYLLAIVAPPHAAVPADRA